MADVLNLAKSPQLRKQAIEEIRARAVSHEPLEFLKSRELYYFYQGSKHYPNPLNAACAGYNQIPEFIKTVKTGDFTLNALKNRFGFGFVVPALFIGCTTFYIGKSSAYLFRKDGDVLGVKH